VLSVLVVVVSVPVDVVVSGASAPLAAPVPPSVIAVSPVGDDETLTGVSFSLVDDDDDPHAYNVALTINTVNSFFITVLLMNNYTWCVQKIVPRRLSLFYWKQAFYVKWCSRLN